MTPAGVLEFLRGLLLGTQAERRSRRYYLFQWLRGIDLRAESIERLGLCQERSNWYSNSGGPDLRDVCSILSIAPGARAIDIGCGKGGALLTLKECGFGAVDGVEISARLVAIARKNLKRAGVRNSRIILADAAEFTGFDDYTHVYMYNPFPEPIVRAVCRNLLDSLQRRRRQLTLIYKNPVHSELFVKAGFYRCAEFTHSDLPFAVFRFDPQSV